MTPDDLAASVTAAVPPTGLALPLQALWWDAKGDWDQAHACAQQEPGAIGAAVHAYLHRKEGDLANAGYWYSRAGRPVFTGPLPAEWPRAGGRIAGRMTGHPAAAGLAQAARTA